MQVMTVILAFEDGQQIALIGPYQAIPDADIENCYFSEPTESPDMNLSDLAGMRFEVHRQH